MFVREDAERIAHNLCTAVASQSDMPLAAARIGLWLAGRVEEHGAPLDTSIREIQRATRCHISTVHTAIDWLKGNHIIATSEGSVLRGGYKATRVSAP